MNPSVPTCLPTLQPVSKEESFQEIVNSELKPEGVNNSVNMEENLPFMLTALKGRGENVYQFDNQSSGTTSALVTPSKIGELCLIEFVFLWF